MSEQPIEIPVTLDAQGFTAGAARLTEASSDLQQSFRGLSVTTGSVQKLYDAVTPSRAAIAGMGTFAAMAANTQQRMSGLNATSAITKVNVDKLGGSIRQMSRDMPMGAKQTTAVVEQFTRMGVAAAGSEKKIASLSKSVINLSGATGEGPAELADGMTNLARATGNANLDPKRFEALGDSLTRVSKESGAGAVNVLAFSKNIAPMANAAGIGSVGILGISSAFARLGEDGLGASTAVNKMLTDMSRSVREGGPQMRGYAEIVGKTTSEFERLFKANPTEALTQVTEAIAQAGPGGTRMLEQLGAGSVREQRALTALSASGGLRPAIASATTGYGSGDTETAAMAAFGGLNDSLTELRETTTQVAEAMGAPLLGPLTMFSDALKVPMELLGSVVGSGAGQGILTAGAYAAGPALALKSMLGPLTMLGLGRQGLTSTPLRAAAAGIAEGRNLPASSFLSRFGAPITNAASEGVMGTIGGKMMNIGREIGQGMGSVGVQRQSVPSRFRELAFGGAGSAAQLSFNMATESLMNAATTDPTKRTQVGFNAGPAFEGGWKEFKESFKPGGGGIGAAMTNFRDRTAEAGKGIGAMTGAAKAYAKVPLAAAQVGGAMAKDAAGIGGKLLKAGGEAIGAGSIVAGGAVGLTTGFMLARASQKRGQEEISARQDVDIRGSINTYRESIGLATSQTVTLGNSMGSLAKNIALTTTTFAQAREVTAKDIATTKVDKDKVITNYSGSRREVAAQISGMNIKGMNQQELAAVKQDLLRSGRGAGEVEKILEMVDTGGVGSKQGAAGARQIQQMVTGAAKSERGGFMGFLADVQNLEGTGLTRPGGLINVGDLGAAGQQQITNTAMAIGQRTEANVERYGARYAKETEARDMEKAMKAALKTGNNDLVDGLSKTFTETLGYKGTTLTPEQMQAKGFIGALMEENEKAAKKYKGTDLTGRGTEAVEQQGFYAREMRKRGQGQFGQYYDYREQGAIGQQVQASLAAPENVKKFTTAVESLTNSAKKGSKTWEDIAFDARASVRGLDEKSPVFQMQMAVAARAQQKTAAEQIEMSPAQRLVAQREAARRELALPMPTDKVGQQRREEAIQAEQGTSEMAQAQVVARATQIRQYQLSYARAFEDFERSQEYAEEDYIRSRGRAQRNFGIQMDRLREDAAKQMYNPYERIMTQPVWDTQNLMGNLKEQTEAMEKQTQQLAALRKKGVSQQTIDTLELYKPENAQQLDYMTSDLKQDPKLIDRLNRQTASRGKAAGDLATDKSNVDFRRMTEDFQRGLGDMSKDMDRARDRNQEQFQRGISRMTEDVVRAGETIAGNALDLGKKIERGLKNQAVNWTQVMVDETQQIIDTYSTDVVPKVAAVAGQAFAGIPGMENYTPSTFGPRIGAQDRNAGENRVNPRVTNTSVSSTPIVTSPMVMDNRVDLTNANISVHSNDPEDMGRKIERRTRQANLTRGGVPHSAVGG